MKKSFRYAVRTKCGTQFVEDKFEIRMSQDEFENYGKRLELIHAAMIEKGIELSHSVWREDPSPLHEKVEGYIRSQYGRADIILKHPVSSPGPSYRQIEFGGKKFWCLPCNGDSIVKVVPHVEN